MVVGHLVWDEDNHEDAAPTVRPSATLMLEAAPLTILSKLRHLLSISVPDAFHHLQRLRSRYWSFVDVSPRTRQADAA
jgi:hypothetical protein